MACLWLTADTLQGFLARAKEPTPERHLYMVDESSLASTRQVQDFLGKLGSGGYVTLLPESQGLSLSFNLNSTAFINYTFFDIDQFAAGKVPPRVIELYNHADSTRGAVHFYRQFGLYRRSSILDADGTRHPRIHRRDASIKGSFR